MAAYYNENEKGSAAWLRELILDGLIADGVVDERSITEVMLEDLKGFTQVHLFAGIGGWPLALRLAGWPDDLPVWTGSCPCQPFSAAGKQQGVADERHLWPEFYRLIRQCHPPILFIEQVESAVRHGWLDGVFTDLEAEGYACGAAVLGAHSVGSPHIRQRLFGMAHSNRPEFRGWREKRFQSFGRLYVANGRSHDGLADARSFQSQFVADDSAETIAEQGSDEETVEFTGRCGAGWMADSTNDRRTEHVRESREREIAGPLNATERAGVSRVEYTAGDGRQQRRTEPSGGALPADAALAGWVTPSSRDHKDTPGMATTGKNPDGSIRSRMDQLPRQAHGIVSELSTVPTAKRGAYQLNPRFSLWLMGFPAAWASCGERAMQSCRKSRRSSSKPTCKALFE